MAREAASIDTVVRDAMVPVIQRASVQIARAIADMAAARLDAELQDGVAKAGRGAGARAGRRAGARARPREEITRWAADRRARRVPNFVIEATGLKTKKQIVARFGDGAVFEKGKPMPKPK